MTNSPMPTGDSDAHACHAHTSPAGLHHVGRGHWARNLVTTIVGAVRSLVR